MERISNGWQIARASWHVLGKDRELVAIPVIAGLVSLLVIAVVAGGGYLVLGGSEAVEAGNAALWILGLVAVIGATWVSTIGQAAVIAGAAERMDGGDPTLASAYERASGRAARLLQWAVLATVVAVVLDQIEERLGILGKAISWFGSIAFGVLSFLALPVIVFEDVGAIEGFKRSSALLRRTWGEQLTFNFGIGIVGLLAALPGVVLGFLLLASGMIVLQALGVVVLVGWLVTVSAVTSALSAVFKAALYRWAMGLPVDPSFDVAGFSAAFRRR